MFIVIGLIGAGLLLLTLVFDDLFDGVLPESDWLSLTSIATFLTAFGFGAYVLSDQADLPAGLAAAGGAAAGVGLGAIAVRWSRSLSDMATDATPTSADLLGLEGKVVTAILPRSTGEAMVRLGGQPVKLTAVADGIEQPIDRGTSVVVVGVISPTRVQVQTAEEFWSSTGQR